VCRLAFDAGHVIRVRAPVVDCGDLEKQSKHRQMSEQKDEGALPACRHARPLKNIETIT
jgi:hypothetical protein